jgi:hypothetical protein
MVATVACDLATKCDFALRLEAAAMGALRDSIHSFATGVWDEDPEWQ